MEDVSVTLVLKVETKLILRALFGPRWRAATAEYLDTSARAMIEDEAMAQSEDKNLEDPSCPSQAPLIVPADA
jgi:hypothetical protein